MTFADVSAAFLASNEAGIVDEFAILYLINVCRPPHAALSWPLRAPACTPCLAPHNRSTAHAVRSWNPALSPAAYPPARALPAAVSHLPILPRDQKAPSDRPAHAPLAPLPPHSVSPLSDGRHGREPR